MTMTKIPDIIGKKYVIRAKDIIGKPIVTSDTGEEIETVEDIMFDRVSNQIVALTVDKGRWSGSTRVLPWGDVKTIGEDAVIATSRDAIKPADDLKEAERVLERENMVIGKKLMTDDGRDLGTLAGIYFNNETGVIAGYEVSGGIFADTMNGRSYMPAAMIVNFGDDAAIVSASTADMLEEQVGGLKQSMQMMQNEWQSLFNDFESAIKQARGNTDEAAFSARQAAKDVKSQAEEGLEQLNNRLDEAAAKGEQSVKDTTNMVRVYMTQLLAERVIEQTKGSVAQESVLSDDNQLIVTAGQTVTDHVIENAHAHHKEVALMNAVGLEVSDVVNNNMHQLQNAIEEHANTWVEHGRSITGRLREKAIEIANDVKTRLEKTDK